MKNKQIITKKILIKTGISLLIIIPLFVIILYLKGLISKTTTKIVTSRKEFISRSTNLESLVVLQSQYKNFGRDYLMVLYNIVPQKDNLINVSKEIQRLAVKNNLNLNFSFTGEKEASEQELGYISFKVTIKGETISQIKKFIEDFNNFKYLNKIESVSMKKIFNVNNNSEKIIEKVEASMDAKIYFRLFKLE
jgi:uncharacterized protein with NAD-binding domain and iron-sulfur cluster